MIYFTATTGNDGNPGTSDRPFRTIQRGADALQMGDTLTIRGGVYAEHVMLHISGNFFSRQITIQAAEGENVIIQPKGLPESGAIFDTNGQDHLIIRGIHVKDGGFCGIRVIGSWKVQLENCSSHNTPGSGIMIDKSQGVSITGCEVEKACQKGGEESISIKRSAEVLLQKSTVHDTLHEGVDVKEGSKHVRVLDNYIHHTKAQGLYAEAWDSDTYDIHFERNRVHDCMAGFAACTESGGLLKDVWFVNNLIYDCQGPGMIVAKWGHKEMTHRIQNVYLLNNTVVRCGHGPDHPTWGGGVLLENDQAENIVVMNNILSGSPDGQLRITLNLPPKSYKAVNNLLDGEFGNLSEGNLLGSAGFLDAKNHDYRLSANSKAIGAGIFRDDLTRFDLSGKPRSHNGKVDLGAFAYTKP